MSIHSRVASGPRHQRAARWSSAFFHTLLEFGRGTSVVEAGDEKRLRDGSPWLLSVLMFFGGLGLDSVSAGWPQRLDYSRIPLEIERERDADTGVTRYQAGAIVLYSESPLPRDRTLEIMRVAGSVGKVLGKLPLGVARPPGQKTTVIRVFSSEDSYEKAGGSGGTAGQYSIRRREVLIREKSLLEDRSPVRDDGGRYDVLVHELTHRGMHGGMYHWPGWVIEGVAEYMAAAHVRPAIYEFQKVEPHIVRHVRRYTSGRAIRYLGDGPEFWNFGVSRWSGSNTEGATNNYEKYASALLAVHWLLHRQAGGASKLRNYLQELEAGTGRGRFRGRRIPGIWTARERKALGVSLRRYWAPQGIRLGGSSR